MENPIIRKELIYRLRPRKGNDTIVGVLIVGACVIGAIYWLFLRWMITDPSSVASGDTWKILTTLEFMMICLAAPAIAANAISLEKEQQTWEMLIFTCLTPAEIILGKLFARLVSILAIVVILAPISIFAWFRNWVTSGNIPFSQVLYSLLLLVATAVFFSTLGLFVSWLFRRTIYAVMASYTFAVGFLCIGTVMITSGIMLLTRDEHMIESFPLMWLNPIYLIAKALYSGSSYNEFHLFNFLSGIVMYIIMTIFMLVFMIVKFRRFSYAR